MEKTSEAFVTTALSKQGFAWNDTNPHRYTGDRGYFDCSGLVYFCAKQVGLADFPKISGEQSSYCKAQGTDISLAEARATRGALVFRHKTPQRVGHVAISLGNGGGTIEAMDVKNGVRVYTMDGRQWDAAARVPGLRYVAATPKVDDVRASRAIVPRKAKLTSGRWPFVALAPGNDALQAWNGIKLKGGKPAFGLNVVFLPAAIKGRTSLSVVEAPDGLSVVVVDQTDGGTFVYPYVE
jgi:hypothetical protein